jgi:quercetin dioxygenase-like cupin family protein
MTESEGHSYTREHKLQGEAIQLKLAEQSAEVLEEAKASSQGRSARTVIKEGPLRLTLLALREGGVVDEHRTGNPVSIHVLNDGLVTIDAGGKSYELGRQEALVLDADVAHALRAAKDTVLLVTLAVSA